MSRDVGFACSMVMVVNAPAEYPDPPTGWEVIRQAKVIMPWKELDLMGALHDVREAIAHLAARIGQRQGRSLQESG